MLTDFQILHHGPGQEDAAWPYECQLYFGREIEKDVRAEDAKVIRQLVEALENTSDLVFKDVRLSHTRNLALQLGRTWLAEQPQEAPHATPA